MVKNEQFRSVDQFKRILPFTSSAAFPMKSNSFQTTSVSVSQLPLHMHGIDVSSIKGQFAWEKIVLSDTYMPVIFRGNTKYFCVKMLHTLLPEYPEDFAHRALYYQYRKPIDLFTPTINEIQLLNRINAQHAHWAYSRQPFTVSDELVCVSDFIPYYEHLRMSIKANSMNRNTATTLVQSSLPQTVQPAQLASDFPLHMSNKSLGYSMTPVKTKPVPLHQPYPLSELTRDGVPTMPRPTAPVSSSSVCPSQPPKHDAQPRQASKHFSVQPRQQLSSPFVQESRPSLSTNITESMHKVPVNKHDTNPVPTTSSQPSILILEISSSSTDPVVPSSTVTVNRTLSTSSSEKPLTPISKQSSSSSSANLHSGWLQINKLYTPYVSSSTSDHHMYKIPVSLLTFYELLKTSSENNTNDSRDPPFLNEQTLVTPQEIELINELCLKQNIKPFSIDTKLIDLLTFYQSCSTNVIFIKELPLNDPKASICKDWTSIVQINGGICRLRNITTLHEQTVPFIGNNLLKNFIISSQCLLSATLTTPTAAEIEFLQLILFFSNMSINLRNAKLIDIESVRKEYNVDLILLFNDKFPLNVLNYQNQANAPSTSQGQTNQSDTSAATNMFAESTPPPSPLSPAANKVPTPQTCQLPLTSSTTTSPNRYQKTITFHGHSITAYICSGLESNTQRECIPIRALCNVLYPNSSLLDKLEARMLRLLRLKKINRFRPQNQQSLNFTRLVDIQDIEKHWDYIEKGMQSIYSNAETTKLTQESTLTISDNGIKASTLDKVEQKNHPCEQETSIEVHKYNKRPLESEPQDTPMVEKVDNKCKPNVTNDNNDPSKLILLKSPKPMEQCYSDNNESDEKDNDNDVTDKIQLDSQEIELVLPHKMNLRQNVKETKRRLIRRLSNESIITTRKQVVPVKKKIKINRKKRSTIMRSRKQSIAGWVKKYNIEECCILLDSYNPNTDPMEI